MGQFWSNAATTEQSIESDNIVGNKLSAKDIIIRILSLWMRQTNVTSIPQEIGK